MQCPARGGSDYFNYKKKHSIVLLAVCDGQYKFLLVDIGDAGRQSYGSVYANSHLGYAIDNGLPNFPAPNRIGNSNEAFPYVFLADDAFGLKTYMMQPYLVQIYRKMKKFSIIDCQGEGGPLKTPLTLLLQDFVFFANLS